GFPRAAVRYTVTCTRSGVPSTGSFGNVTSAGTTDTCPPMTWFCCDVVTVYVTAGPVAERSVQLSNASAVAPASAPASAEFCACVRAVISMPTSIASVQTPRNARNPSATKASENPSSPRASCRSPLLRVMTPPERRALLAAFVLVLLVDLRLVSRLRGLQTGRRVGDCLFLFLLVFLPLFLELGVPLRDFLFAATALGHQLLLTRVFLGLPLVRHGLVFRGFLVGGGLLPRGFLVGNGPVGCGLAIRVLLLLQRFRILRGGRRRLGLRLHDGLGRDAL